MNKKQVHDLTISFADPPHLSPLQPVSPPTRFSPVHPSPSSYRSWTSPIPFPQSLLCLSAAHQFFLLNDLTTPLVTSSSHLFLRFPLGRHIISSRFLLSNILLYGQPNIICYVNVRYQVNNVFTQNTEFFVLLQSQDAITGPNIFRTVSLSKNQSLVRHPVKASIFHCDTKQCTSLHANL